MSKEAYYRKVSEGDVKDGEKVVTYESTIHAQGAWQEHEQHMAPATGILAWELEHFNPRDDMRIARISLDILGMIPRGTFTVETRSIRPGRTIELLESTFVAENGRPTIVARAWRLMTQPTDQVAGLEDQVVLSPEEAEPWHGMETWPGGYIESIETRSAPGHRRGKGIVWLTNPYDMVEGSPSTSFTKILGMVDTANGVFPRVHAMAERWAYPNVDLQIHMHRKPTGEWLGIQGVQQYGTDGIGLTSAILHDISGPFGRSEQILTVRPMP